MKFAVERIHIQLTPREARVIWAVLSHMHEDDPPGEAATTTGYPIEEICSTSTKFEILLKKFQVSD